MARRAGSRFTYANVTATLALIIAAGGGTAYAAGTIGSEEVVDGSLKSIDLKDGTGVRSADVAFDSLTGADINEDMLAEVPSAAHAGIDGYERVYSGNKTIAAGSQPVISADCPAGKIAISGGFWTSYGDIRAFWGYVVDNDTYSVAFWNTGGEQREVGVHVVCVRG